MGGGASMGTQGALDAPAGNSAFAFSGAVGSPHPIFLAQNMEGMGNGPGGIRLGNFLQIRAELGNGLQEIFANKTPVQPALDNVVERGNAVLRRFEQTYKGKQLP